MYMGEQPESSPDQHDHKGEDPVNNDEDEEWSHFLIAGIFVGCVVILIVMICLVVKLIKKMKQRRAEARQKESKKKLTDSQIQKKNRQIERALLTERRPTMLSSNTIVLDVNSNKTRNAAMMPEGRSSVNSQESIGLSYESNPYIPVDQANKFIYQRNHQS